MTRRTQAGFSLTELLLAMGLFALISVGLVSLLARSSDFLTAGSSTTEQLDALQTFSEAFDADVRSLYTQQRSDTLRPEVRLYSDLVSTDVTGDERGDAQVQRLFFVRMIPAEATAAVTRWAGTEVETEGYLDQRDDLSEAREGKLRPTGGLMEVFWTAIPDLSAHPDDQYATMTVWRGHRAPIGGPGSLLPDMASSDPRAAGVAERGPLHASEVRAVARPVLSGVLHFGVEFWSRKTQSWEATRPPPDGPSLTWDSTRGILPKTRGPDGFFLSKLGGVGDTEALDDPTDDTFPRSVRVTVVVEEVGEGVRVGRLAAPLSKDARSLELHDARFLPATDTARRFVKIGAEWIQFEGQDGLRLTGLRRGARGTLAAAHEPAAIVHHGRTLVREYSIATYRDAYRDDLPAVGR